MLLQQAHGIFQNEWGFAFIEINIRNFKFDIFQILSNDILRVAGMLIRENMHYKYIFIKIFLLKQGIQRVMSYPDNQTFVLSPPKIQLGGMRTKSHMEFGFLGKHQLYFC